MVSSQSATEKSTEGVAVIEADSGLTGGRGTPRRWLGLARHVLVVNSTAIGATAAVLAILICVTLRVWSDRGDTIQEGIRSAENLVQLLDEQAARALQSVDLTMLGVLDAMRLRKTVRDYDPEVEAMLRERVKSLPYIRALFVVSANGIVVQHSRSPGTRGISVADRDYFSVHLDDSTTEPYVGAPFHGRVTDAPSIGMSREIDGPDGGFDGVITAAVDPRYFEGLYRSLRLSPADSVALFHTNGALLSMSPAHPAAAPRLDPKSLQAAMSPAGTVVNVIDGHRYIVSARQLATVPVVVAVARSEDALLATWRRKAVMAYIESGVLAVVLVALALLLSWHRQRFQVARERQMQAHNLESLGRMTGGIAHDFRNILAIIRTSLDAARSSRDRAKIERWVAIGADAATQGDQLVARLLAFSKYQELSVCAVDVNDEIRSVTPLLQEAAGPLITIGREFGEAVWPCLMDRNQFASALINLVINARDATARRGHIRISTANLADGVRPSFQLPLGEYVKVTVRDDGEGMPASVVRRAVEPFFTTKDRQGTGLGLSQVYGFVHQLGGDLRIESEVGIGTSVHLVLPRAYPDAARDRPAPAVTSAGSQGSRSVGAARDRLHSVNS